MVAAKILGQGVGAAGHAGVLLRGMLGARPSSRSFDELLKKSNSRFGHPDFFGFHNARCQRKIGFLENVRDLVPC